MFQKTDALGNPPKGGFLFAIAALVYLQRYPVSGLDKTAIIPQT